MIQIIIGITIGIILTILINLLVKYLDHKGLNLDWSRIFILIVISSYSVNNIYKINIKLIFSLCIFLISLIITILNMPLYLF